MARRQPLPTRWLMTDERMGARLWEALDRLPRGGGVVFRHYGLAPAERRALFAQVAGIARRRGLVLVRAGPTPLGRGEAGVHNRRGRGLRTFAAHDRREAIAAVRAGAGLLFVSPVFRTRSHPGTRTLGTLRLRRVAADLGVPVIALGGVDERRFARLRPLGVSGWAGIDAWTRESSRPKRTADQKRKAVPT